jgi:hypothetical protein
MKTTFFLFESATGCTSSLSKNTKGVTNVFNHNFTFSTNCS